MKTLTLGDVFGNDRILYYPNDDKYVIHTTSHNLQVGKCGDLKFKVPKLNPAHDSLEEQKVVTILDDGREIWRGYIKEITGNMEDEVEIYCLEDLNWLSTEYIPPERNRYNRASKLQQLIADYNQREGITGTVKVFEAGYVSTAGNGTLEVTYDTSLLDALRGLAGDNMHVRVRRYYDNNNVLHRYIDFVSLAYFGKTSTQEIKFGSNITKFLKKMQTGHMLNVINPYGAEIEGEEIFEGCTKRIVGTPLKNQTSINKYGRIEKNIMFNTDDPTTLQEEAALYLQQNADPRLRFELSAIDLADAGYQVDRLLLGDKVKVIAEPFNIDQYVYITELTLDIIDPSKNKVTLSSTVTKKQTISAQTSNIIEDIKRKMPSASAILASAKTNAMRLLEGGYDGGYIRYVFNSNGQMIAFQIADSPVIGNETKMWIWNSGGLGYAEYDEDTGQWVPKVAMTMDGAIVADLITVGTMLADRIHGGTLTLGGLANVNGVFILKDASNNTVVQMNSDGLQMLKGVIRSGDYAEADQDPDPYYSLSGMKIDLIQSFIKSPFFHLSNYGCHVKGSIEAHDGQIGAATIDQDAIKIIGDIKLKSGSGSFKFKPADYYFLNDFKLLFKTTSGTSTVTLVKHYNGSDTTIGTYTANITGVQSAYIDHTIGGSNYYTISVTSSTQIIADDVLLAYMGAEGFRGILEGIFKGVIDANGTFKGYIESDSGIINGYTYTGGGHFNNGSTHIKWSDFKHYDESKSLGYDSHGIYGVKKQSSGDHHFILAIDNDFDTANDGTVDAESAVPRINMYLNKESGGNTTADIYKEDSNGATGVVWENEFDNKFNSHFTISTVDIGENAPLAEGQFWIVYEA